MNPFTALLRQAAQIQQLDHPLRVVGIDLGTTNSTVAEIVWIPGQDGPPQVRCLEIDQETAEGLYSHVLVPSMVAIHNGRTVVGEGAKRLRTLAPELGLEQCRELFWECKNDMGLKRTYHRAPPGFRSAREIAGHVLRFLRDAALAGNDIPIDRTVVTVPASFQTAQRQDTMEAGRLAGLELVGGDLIDEPVAAFVDYVFTQGIEGLGQPGERKNLLVFDFGGGTCDVAMFRVAVLPPGQGLEIAPLAVSRYHRLGGGDIDAAIVYEALVPQLRAQNQLSEFALSYEDKKRRIEPVLLGVAEALKIGLCTEVARLDQFGRYKGKGKIVKKQPGSHLCRLSDKRVLRLQDPTLSAAQFEKLLQRFLDRDVLCAEETEYRTSCSIFSPLSDAVDRSGLTPANIDFCLLVGGSSLILSVQQAIASYFPNAQMLTPGDADAMQTAVARGGAYHALMLAATGRGLVQPVAPDSIAIRTADGPVELLPKNVELPYPKGKRWAEDRTLTVPSTDTDDAVELRIELVNSDGVILARVLWNIPPPVRQGDPLLLKYRLDENQTLELTMHLAGAPNRQLFSCTFENPLTYVVNPQVQRQMIDELEEKLRTRQVPREKQPYALALLAELHRELGQRERALELLRRALRASGRPNAVVLNQMGLLCEELRDWEKAERFLREAAAVEASDGTPLFNLAVVYHRRGKQDQALATVEEALQREQKAPYFLVRALIAAALRKSDLSKRSLDEALRRFGYVELMSDWELSWFPLAATLDRDQVKIAQAKEERLRRKRSKVASHDEKGHLPRQLANPEPDT